LPLISQINTDKQLILSFKFQIQNLKSLFIGAHLFAYS